MGKGVGRARSRSVAMKVVVVVGTTQREAWSAATRLIDVGPKAVDIVFAAVEIGKRHSRKQRTPRCEREREGCVRS